jgi:DNA-binding response OmpR family regulator
MTQKMYKRIIVIDQSRTVQMLLRTYFGNAGHQVLTCSTAEEALRVFVGLRHAPDLIFLAIDHEKEAYNVITYVKAHGAYAQTRLVILVPTEEQAAIQHTLGMFNVSYLPKPFHIQDALALVCASGPAPAASSGSERKQEGNP